MGVYDLSVGRGTNMLLNIGPDRRGLLPDPDAANLRAFGAALRKRFAHPVLTFEQFERSDNTWVATFKPRDITLNQLVMMEDLGAGEAVKRFEIRVTSYVGGRPVLVYEGRNLGHKHIATFPRVRAPRSAVGGYRDGWSSHPAGYPGIPGYLSPFICQTGGLQLRTEACYTVCL